MSNDKPVDYWAGPSSDRERGQTGKPLWVLIEKDENSRIPFRGLILGSSEDRQELTSALKHLQELKNEQKAELGRVQERDRAVDRPLKEREFGPELAKFKRGHSI